LYAVAPPGVYSYDVKGQHGGGRQPVDFVCSTYYYEVTLPGAMRRDAEKPLK
jgi:hypothetical protein